MIECFFCGCWDCFVWIFCFGFGDCDDLNVFIIESCCDYNVLDSEEVIGWFSFDVFVECFGIFLVLEVDVFIVWIVVKIDDKIVDNEINDEYDFEGGEYDFCL